MTEVIVKQPHNGNKICPGCHRDLPVHAAIPPVTEYFTEQMAKDYAEARKKWLKLTIAKAMGKKVEPFACPHGCGVMIVADKMNKTWSQVGRMFENDPE